MIETIGRVFDLFPFYILLAFDILLLFSLLLLLFDLLGIMACKVLGLYSHPVLLMNMVFVFSATGIACYTGIGTHIKKLVQSNIATYNIEAWLTALACIWAVGMTASVGIFIVRHIRFSRRLKNAKIVPPEQAFLEAQKQAQVKNVVCKELPDLRSVGMYSFFEPVIVLPVGFSKRYNEQERFFIYLHELIHIKNHDFALNMISRFFTCVFYLHLPIRWQLQKLMQYREMLCDRHVMRVCPNPAEYAALLISEARLNSALSVSLSGKEFLYARISALFPTTKIDVIKTVILIAVLFSMAILPFGYAQTDESPAPVFVLGVEYNDRSVETFPLESLSDAEKHMREIESYYRANVIKIDFYWEGMLNTYMQAVPVITY